VSPSINHTRDDRLSEEGENRVESVIYTLVVTILFIDKPGLGDNSATTFISPR
jgi:hypothetical protein